MASQIQQKKSAKDKTGEIVFTSDLGPITKFSWGLFTIRSQEHGKKDGLSIGSGKDIVVTSTDVFSWSARVGHKGSLEMLKPALDLRPKVLIIGNGVWNFLKFSESIIAKVEALDIKVLVTSTPSACWLYNKECEKGLAKDVVLLAHGTC